MPDSLTHKELLQQDLGALEKSDINDLYHWVGTFRSQSADYGDGFSATLTAEEMYQLNRSLLTIEEMLEHKVAKHFLKGNPESLARYLSLTSVAYYTAEADYLSQYGDQLCFIGSGAIPHSAIVYYEKQKLRTLLIEQNQQASELSKAVLIKYYGKKIVNRYFDFCVCPGENWQKSNSDYHLGVIAGHCSNKKALLNNLFKQMPRGSRILQRRPKGLYQVAYEEVNLDSESGYDILQDGKVIGCSNILKTPQIYQKKGR